MESTSDLRELADRLEIGELIARYAAAVDDRDYSAVVAAFTEDGILSRPPWRVTGAADLEKAYRAALGRYEWTVHAVHGHAVDFTGRDEAVGFVGCRAEHALDGEVVVAALRVPRRVPPGRRAVALPQPRDRVRLRGSGAGAGAGQSTGVVRALARRGCHPLQPPLTCAAE